MCGSSPGRGVGSRLRHRPGPTGTGAGPDGRADRTRRPTPRPSGPSVTGAHAWPVIGLDGRSLRLGRQAAGDADERRHPRARGGRQRHAGSRAGPRAARRRGSPAAARPTCPARGGRRAGRWWRRARSGAMPMPQSSTVSSQRARFAAVGARADGDRRVRRREPHRVLGQLREQVGQVGDRVPDDRGLLVDDDHHAGQVLGLRDRRAQHVAQRHRLAPGARRLLAGEHQQVLRVAADPGRDVVEPEELGQRVRVLARTPPAG